jgi:hypothetical protein
MGDSAEVRGVRLRDVYRDKEGALWEVVGLCTEPTAIVQKVTSGEKQTHVIDCLNWQSKWESGPLRAQRDDT